MINTKYIREQIARAQELPWMLATSNSWRRFVDARHTPVCQPIAQSDGHPDLLFVGGAEGPNAQLLIGAVNTLPKLLDHIDAQAAEIAGARQTIERWKERLAGANRETGALKRDISDYIRIGNEHGAEIARLREAQAWQSIETAPRDGTDIMLSDGEHVTVGHWYHEEGGITEHRDLDGRWVGQDESDGFDGWIDWIGGITPTHWTQLPAAPGVPQETSHGR